MRVRRRNLRKGLVAVGCLFGWVDGWIDGFGAIAWPAGAGLFGFDRSFDLGAWRVVLTLLLLVLGSALHLASKGYLEQNRRLVTAGPYRFTRNPFYLANLLLDLGLCCVIGRVSVAIPYLGLWWLAYRATIEGEEVRLAALFPEEFPRYVAAVPRLVATGRRLPRAEAAGSFSFDNPALARGSEYARVLGIWIAAAAILACSWLGREGLAAFAVENAGGLGLVALVSVGGGLKLALAEVFRRPETALLPFDAEPARRRAVALGLVLALYAVMRLVGDRPASGSAWEPASPALPLAFAALLVLPFARSSAAGKLGVLVVLFAAIAAFAAAHGILVFAAAPLLWVALMAFDELARERMPRAGTRAGGASSDDRDAPLGAAASRPLWPMARPLSMFVLGGTGLLFALRLLV